MPIDEIPKAILERTPQMAEIAVQPGPPAAEFLGDGFGASAPAAFELRFPAWLELPAIDDGKHDGLRDGLTLDHTEARMNARYP